MTDDRTAESPTRALRPARLRPEEELMRAVLDDAARTHRGIDGSLDARRRRMRREVEEWFASDARDHSFAFVNVCRALGLDPPTVRAEVVAPPRPHA